MKYRDLAKRLKRAGFTATRGKGDHEKWTAPDGTHVTITRSREISPGVASAALRAIERWESST